VGAGDGDHRLDAIGAAQRSDPIDAHVVLLARERGWPPVLTSDPGDVLAIDPMLVVERI